MEPAVQAMVSFQFQTIHTLEARSNVLLEAMTQHLNLTDPQVFQMIQGMLVPTVQILANKGIIYKDLRRVLVPSRDRHSLADEAAEAAPAQCRRWSIAIHSLRP